MLARLAATTRALQRNSLFIPENVFSTSSSATVVSSARVVPTLSSHIQQARSTFATSTKSSGVSVDKYEGTGSSSSSSSSTDKVEEKVLINACGPVDQIEDDEDELEEMFVQTEMGSEWGGPTRGGRMPEPTRFGDWERKGRCSDFS
jgi:hypothetical protein